VSVVSSLKVRLESLLVLFRRCRRLQLRAELAPHHPPLSSATSASTTTTIAFAPPAAAMSVDPPEFVRSLQNNIRSRPIPWEGAVRAKTISEAHLKKIKAVDKVRREARKRILESETAEYVSLFLGRQDEPGILQTAAKRQDIVLYLLVLLEDLMQGTGMLLARRSS
jgi:hypothetical protein